MKYFRYLIVSMLLLTGAVVISSCSDDEVVEICNDGIDNDNDGFTDCDDNDCMDDALCDVEICNDGIDNDNDGFTDCDDNDCVNDPGC